jgi:hypothetical protein
VRSLVRIDTDHHFHHWVLLFGWEPAVGTPDSKDEHAPLVSQTTGKTPTGRHLVRQPDNEIGRQFESDPAGAPRRYENPRDAYNNSIRQFGVPSWPAIDTSACERDRPAPALEGHWRR